MGTCPLSGERLATLPGALRDFFGEELATPNPRLTILTEVVRSERTEQNEPIPEGHREIGRWLIGEDLHYIFQISGRDKLLEIRVRSGGYYHGELCDDLFTNPERKLEVNFLPVVAGKYILDDPRNSTATGESLPDEVDAFLADTLAFAIRERRRQLPDSTS